MSQSIRVVTVDDHRVIRTGVRTMLGEGGEEFALVGDAADGETALGVISELQPDVVLMDLRMPGMDGIKAIEQIHQRWPRIAIVILTTYNEDALMIRGLQAGACGYLLKDADLEVLLDSIRAAARGERLVQPEMVERLLMHAARATQTPPMPSLTRPSEKPRGKSRAELTEREREVLIGVARGERSKGIAKRRGLQSERWAPISPASTTSWTWTRARQPSRLPWSVVSYQRKAEHHLGSVSQYS